MGLWGTNQGHYSLETNLRTIPENVFFFISY